MKIDPNKIDEKTYEFLREVQRDFSDDALFAADSLSIRSREGAVIPLIPNHAQIKLFETIRKIQERKRPVRIIILKSRRQGLTTGIAAKIFRETVFTPGQHAVVIAHHETPLKESIYPMYRLFQEQYKPFRQLIGLPALERDTDKVMEWDNASKIEIRTATTAHSVRSANLRRCHLSEAAFYQDMRKVMTAITTTVPRDPDTMILVESTANGMGGPFWELWNQATDPSVGSEWVPIFFGCYDDPVNWMDLGEVTPEKFESTLTDEEWDLRRRHNLALEQLNWRRWSILNEFHGSVDLFRQEMPATPTEAFLAKGSPVFDHKTISRFQPYPGTTGELNLERVGVEKRAMFVPKEKQPLEVWKKPERGHQYVIGVDTATGKNRSTDDTDPKRDFSVAQVLDRVSGEQVARLRARMTERYFGELVYCLGVWYNNAFLVPEMTGGHGQAMVDVVLQLGYPMNLIYHVNRSGPVTYNDLGWSTNTVTRPRLISGIDSALTDRSIEIYDAYTIRELLAFARNNDGKAEAPPGEWDDAVMALGLAIQGLKSAPAMLKVVPGGGHPTATLGPTRYGNFDSQNSGYSIIDGRRILRPRDGRRW